MNAEKHIIAILHHSDFKWVASRQNRNIYPIVRIKAKNNCIHLDLSGYEITTFTDEEEEYLGKMLDVVQNIKTVFANHGWRRREDIFANDEFMGVELTIFLHFTRNVQTEHLINFSSW